jgi:L-fuconate dehydratase
MKGFYLTLAGYTQFLWLGPEKGVIHLPVAAMLNAVWDLYAKAEGKPVWKLLADMSPEQIVDAIDFRYIADALFRDEALDILRNAKTGQSQRLALLEERGYPAYTTSVGWFGFSDETIRRTRKLSELQPWWMEEPTSPDDILGHARIRREAAPTRTATGEHCRNAIMFKQLFQAEAIDVCQIDSCRVAGINENLAILLMAAKFKVPVCPHTGGVRLCEYVQHLSAFDFLNVSCIMKERVTEYVDHLHEHFRHPVVIRNGHYMLPQAPGYNGEILPESLSRFAFPDGETWKGEADEVHFVQA